MNKIRLDPATTKSGIIIGKRFDGRLPPMSAEDRRLQAALLHAAKRQQEPAWVAVSRRVLTYLS